MVYNASVPQPTDNLSDSQNDILNNFSSANTSFGINHFAFDNATANNGKHNFVEMPVRGTAPVGLAANEGTLYTKTTGSTSNLFYTPDAGGVEYQMTTVGDAQIATFGAAGTGWTFLPGGLIMNYGLAVSSGAAGPNASASFSKPYTNAASVRVQILPVNNSSSERTTYLESVSTTSFTAWVTNGSGSTRAGQFHWYAIGK